MPSNPKDSGNTSGTSASGPTAEDIADFLRGHPEFFSDHPEVLAGLTSSLEGSGDNVVDLQKVLLGRLRDENRRLTGSWDELIATSRTNMAGQSQIHEAILAFLEARSLEHLVHTVTADLPQILDLDAVTICVEGGEAPAVPAAAGEDVRLLDSGMVSELLGPGRNLVLGTGGVGFAQIFGPAAPLIRSDALIRLNVRRDDSQTEAPPCLLAMGSRDADKFHPGQGTELLVFLAQALERCLAAWLRG